MAIEFLAIGHITHDRTPTGFRLGGTVSYAAVTAFRLGRRPAILTRATLDQLLPEGGPSRSPLDLIAPPSCALSGIPMHVLPSAVSTTFVNLYRNGRRTQVIESLAEPITPADLPRAWAEVPMVVLGPIAREVTADWADAFPRSLMAVTPQGWMRQWDEAGHVHPGPWEDAGRFLARADAVILSREDVGDDDAYLDFLARRARLLVVTDGWHGATVYQAGRPVPIPPRPAREVDPTGAGDVFAAAFLIRLAETGDPLVAARFANIVASMSVEALGMDAIPFRAQVEAYLAEVAQ